MTKTKAHLVEEVAEATGIPKMDVFLVIEAFLNAVSNALTQNNRIEIRGLGVFKNKLRKKRMARNPRTGEVIEVPERLVPTFKPSRLLKARVSGGK
ncbi:integration host factor subunit beta [candidate division TA06 bacterium]|nr:integration host factor subunit beta [candidate division TA06 bacterium]